jgi:hypothetical protein
MIALNRFLNTVGAKSVDLFTATNVQVNAISNEADKAISISGTTCTVVVKEIAQVP